MSDLAAALLIAIKVHGDQRDKRGEPYLWHVARVVEAVSDEAKVVAALHDVVEDGGATEHDLVAGYGISLSIEEITAVQLLSRRSGHIYTQYIEAIDTSYSRIAREVKLADLRDNLERIPPDPSDWASLKARYESAIYVLESKVTNQAEEKPETPKETRLEQDLAHALDLLEQHHELKLARTRLDGETEVLLSRQGRLR